MDIKQACFQMLAAIMLIAAGLPRASASKGNKGGAGPSRVIYWKDEKGINRSITPANLFEVMREKSVGNRSLLSKVVPGATMQRRQRELLVFVKKMAKDLKRDAGGLTSKDLAEVCENAQPVYRMLGELEGHRQTLEKLLAGETRVDRDNDPEEPFTEANKHLHLGPEDQLSQAFETYLNVFKSFVELDSAYRREVEALVYRLPHSRKISFASRPNGQEPALALDPSGYSWTPGRAGGPITVLANGEQWVGAVAATPGARERVVKAAAGRGRVLPMLEKTRMKPLWLQANSWKSPVILLLHPSGDATKNVLLHIDDSGVPLINAQVAEKRVLRKDTELVDVIMPDATSLSASYLQGGKSRQITLLPPQGDGYAYVRVKGANAQSKLMQVSDLSKTDPTRSKIYHLHSGTVVSPGQLDARALLPADEQRAKALAADVFAKQHEVSEMDGLFFLLESTSY